MGKFNYTLILIAVVISACSTTKYLAPGQKLYDGGEVKIDDKVIKKSDAKALKEEMETLAKEEGLDLEVILYDPKYNPDYLDYGVDFDRPNVDIELLKNDISGKLYNRVDLILCDYDFRLGNM